MPTPVSSAIVSICLPRQPPSPDATRNYPGAGNAAHSGRPPRPAPWAEPLKATVSERKGLPPRPGWAGSFTGTPTKAGHPAEEIYELSVEAG